MNPKDVKITVTIKFGVAHGGEYTIESNGTKAAELAVVRHALAQQRGQPKDNRPPNMESEYYTVTIVYCFDDTFELTHDCGNDGLMTGILVKVLEDAGQWPTN